MTVSTRTPVNRRQALTLLGAAGGAAAATAGLVLPNAVALAQATRIVGTGHSAIVDAVFAQPAGRAAVESAAQDASVPFAGLWLDARPEVLVRRVEGRDADVSDADAAVVRRQLADKVGPVGWHRINAEATLDAMVVEARRPLVATRLLDR